MQKSKKNKQTFKNDEERTMYEENRYRKQLILSHSVLGKDVTSKYDTGEEIDES